MFEHKQTLLQLQNQLNVAITVTQHITNVCLFFFIFFFPSLPFHRHPVFCYFFIVLNIPFDLSRII